MNEIFSDLFKIAIKNIRKKKLRSWLTMIGIFIGVLSIVTLIGLGQGLNAGIKSQFGIFAPDLLSISQGGNGPPTGNSGTPFTKTEVKRVASLKEIISAAGRSVSFNKIEFNNKIAFSVITSIPNGNSRKLVYYGLGIKAKEGRLLKDGDKDKILLGSKYGNKDLFGKKIKVGNTVIVNGRKLKVIGILEKKGSFTVDGTAFLNQKDFESIFNRKPDTYSFIVARYNENIYTSNESKNAVENLLRNLRHEKKGNEDFKVSTPLAAIQNINSTLFAVQLFVYIIAAISLIVGGIGIMTTMYTSVLERTNEIGIMKAIGAKNYMIFIIFFIESGALGLMGGLIGILGGIGIAKSLAKIGQIALGSDLIRAQISPSLIIGTLLFSFILGSLFGVFPAIKASKMTPVEALRSKK